MPNPANAATRTDPTETRLGDASFRTVVQTAGSAIIVFDLEGKIREFNPAAERLHGCTRDDAIGKHYTALFVPKETRAILRNEIRKVAAVDHGSDMEIGIQALDGASRVISWNGTRLRDEQGAPYAMIAIGQDVTARRKAERALRESEQRYRELAEAAPVLVWIADANYECTYVNDAWLEFTGLPRESLLGTAWAELVHPVDHDARWPEYLSAIARRAEFTMDHRLRSADGSYRWLYGKASPRFDADGNFAGFVGCSVDVTERRNAEEALKRANEDLERRVARRTAELSASIRELRSEIADRKEAESRLRDLESELAHALRMSTMGEMAAAIAHELHQPLAAVVNYAGACAELVRTNGVQRAELLTYLEQVSGQTLRAGEIIHRLRRFIEKKEPAPEPLGLAEVIGETAPLLEAEARHLGVELEFVIAERLPHVLGDRIQLQQVIVNLVKNAFEATTSREGAPRRVRVELETPADGDVLEVRIVDSGPGLAADERDKAFEPFYSTKPSGMGFGLSISRSIAEAHGGSLVVRDPSAEGTTFCLALPTLGEESYREH